jgi:tetratricopeptide (TPR) repeat protein
MSKVVAFLVALLISAAALAKTPSPPPDEDARKARLAFQQGLTSYNLSHFDEALQHFDKAYRLRPDPAFLFNIAQCQRQLDRPQDAIRSYRAYLRESPADVPNRAEVQRLIGEMDKVVAERQAAAQPAPAPAPPSPTPAPSLAPQPEATPSLTASAPPPRKKSRTALWVGVGVGAAVLVGVGVGLGVYYGTSASPPGSSLGNYGAMFQ